MIVIGHNDDNIADPKVTFLHTPCLYPISKHNVQIEIYLNEHFLQAHFCSGVFYSITGLDIF